jgi:hypothetical protein
MRQSKGELVFGKGWRSATQKTPSHQLFMPPGNGSLYTPGLLPGSTGHYFLRKSICPDADGVWYWAMARLGGAESLCLEETNHRAIWQQKATISPAASQPGPAEFEEVLRHFNLRDSLIRGLSKSAE